MNEIFEIAERAGLSFLGSISRDSFSEGLLAPKAALADWQSNGHAGKMTYMERDPQLFLDLDNFLPGARSVLLFCFKYSGSTSTGDLTPGYGRVSCYTRGPDYHTDLRERMQLVAQSLGLKNYRTFSDAVPLLERSLAALSGEGFLGKNSMFIIPGVGSYTFLCEILTTDSLSIDAKPPVSLLPGAGCKSCVKCLQACPTGALLGDGVLDSRLCISYLTIEKKGLFSEWEREAIGEWLYGCDICQQVCPFNHRNQSVPHELELKGVLDIKSNRAFEDRFHGSAITRTGRSGLLRNACSVAVNAGYIELIDDLQKLSKEDNSSVVREEAAVCFSEIIYEVFMKIFPLILVFCLAGCATPRSLLLELPEQKRLDNPQIVARDSRIDQAVIRREEGGAVVINPVPEYIESLVVERLQDKNIKPLEIELLSWQATEQGSEIQADAILKVTAEQYSGKYIGKASVISPLLDEEDEVKALAEALSQAVLQLAADDQLVRP